MTTELNTGFSHSYLVLKGFVNKSYWQHALWSRRISDSRVSVERSPASRARCLCA